MGIFGKIGGYLGRGAAAVATGGGSEAYRAATGKVDPYTAYQQRLGQAVGGKVDTATGQGADMPPNPYDSETPEEKRKRMTQEADLNRARAYRDQLARQSADPRAAPQVGAPTALRPAVIGGVAPINAPMPVVAGQVASTFDPTQQAQSRELQQGYLDRVAAAESGAVPSAAEMQMRAGGARAVSQAYALAGGHKGYGGADLRNAQRVGASLQQQNNMATGQLRAGEMATARQEYGQAVQGMRGQDIGVATTGADLALRAAQGNQQTGLQAGIANQGAVIDVAKANQTAALSKNIAQAGFDQQAMMHMSDQELQSKLANAGFHLSQEQIDDLRAHNLQQTQLEANGQVLQGGNAEAQRQAQIKQLRAQYAMAVQQNNQKQQDATLGMLAQLGAAYATGGASAAAPAASPGGDLSQWSTL